MAASRSAKHLDNFHQLVHARLPRKQWPPQQELSEDTAHGPDVDGCGVFVRPQHELRCAVKARADVRDALLPWNEAFGGAEIAEFEHVGSVVNEKVLGLYVAVANAERMQVAEGAAHLIGVEFDKNEGGGCVCF